MDCSLERLRDGLARLLEELTTLVGWPYVAFMSHGVAGSDWESLKRKENCCDKMQHRGGCA